MKSLIATILGFIKAHTVVSIITAAAVVTVSVSTPIIVHQITKPKENESVQTEIDSETNDNNLGTGNDSLDTENNIITDAETDATVDTEITDNTISNNPNSNTTTNNTTSNNSNTGNTNTNQSNSATNNVNPETNPSGNTGNNSEETNTSTTTNESTKPNDTESSDSTTSNSEETDTSTTPDQSTIPNEPTDSQPEITIYPSVKDSSFSIEKTTISNIDIIRINFNFRDNPFTLEGETIYGTIAWDDLYLYKNIPEEKRSEYLEDTNVVYYNNEKYVRTKESYGAAQITFIHELKEENNIVSLYIYEGKKIDLKFEKISESEMKLIYISDSFSPIYTTEDSLLKIGDIVKK